MYSLKVSCFSHAGGLQLEGFSFITTGLILKLNHEPLFFVFIGSPYYAQKLKSCNIYTISSIVYYNVLPYPSSEHLDVAPVQTCCGHSGRRLLQELSQKTLSALAQSGDFSSFLWNHERKNLLFALLDVILRREFVVVLSSKLISRALGCGQI